MLFCLSEVLANSSSEIYRRFSVIYLLQWSSQGSIWAAKRPFFRNNLENILVDSPESWLNSVSCRPTNLLPQKTNLFILYSVTQRSRIVDVFKALTACAMIENQMPFEWRDVQIFEITFNPIGCMTRLSKIELASDSSVIIKQVTAFFKNLRWEVQEEESAWEVQCLCTS